MRFFNKINFWACLSVFGIVSFASNVNAKENIQTNQHRDALKATATGCQPAVATIDLDINNVRARLMTGGDMWWNQGLAIAAYEVPIGSGKNSQFAASCWIGGYDQTGALKVAAQTYRQDGNDYWPGALDPSTAKISSDQCANWDRFWKIQKSTINRFIELSKAGQSTSGSEFDAINQWPGYGNSGALGANGTPVKMYSGCTYAPFVDLNGDGIYQPGSGEYPGFADTKNQIKGDEMIWWVFNDAGNSKQQSQTASIGIEVQAYSFAYSSQDFLNNATFGNYRVINRGALTMDSTYLAVWDDCDLGYAFDDYIGCDTTNGRGLGIMYNGVLCDGQAGGFPVNSYGCSPPQVGLDYFQGPKRIKHRVGLPDTIETLNMTNFTYYNNDNSVIGNPTNGIQIYNYMTGSVRNGDRFANDFKGPGITSKGYGSGPSTNFVFVGDPGDKTTWSECTCQNVVGDRRFIFSAGPFQLLPGAVNDITFGCVWAPNVGGCPNTDFKTIKSIDDGAQALFDAGFKKIEGPQAPRMVIRELDQKLICYLVNDYGSNNYGENYGRTDGSYIDSLNYHQRIAQNGDDITDSLYQFEGYRVFQLANSQVTPAEIFNSTTGEVDNTKAFEVFQCDVKNNVKRLVNYTKVPSISDTTYMAQVKVNGKDSGISHSFVISEDKFSTRSNKALVNYQNYYFVAIAYAQNNFAPFSADPTKGGSTRTQDQPYLASSHGAGYSDISVYTAIPNPSNGAMGTTLNADYGSGVQITRVEGQGNGGNIIELSENSQNEVLSGTSTGSVTYNIGQGPIDIKVIDPIAIKPYDWVLQLKGNVDGAGNLNDSTKWMLTALDNGKVVETIYSESNLGTFNEQILEKYGMSLGLEQTHLPGARNSANKGYNYVGNGYLTSNVIFEDNSRPWLWGVQDQADSNFSNWLRAGNNFSYTAPRDPTKNPCDFNDLGIDSTSAYQGMFGNFGPMESSWGPYSLGAPWAGSYAGTGTQCAFTTQFAFTKGSALDNMSRLPDVNLVLTSDKTKWTRCAVLEMQEVPSLAQGNAKKFCLRKHASWGLDMRLDDGGNPIYDGRDSSMSWFPGYAVDQNGKRLNIVFGEDSYQGNENGGDMIWNPTSHQFNLFDGSLVMGGKHWIYVLSSKYDSCKKFRDTLTHVGTDYVQMRVKNTFYDFAWVGLPLINPALHLNNLAEGLIPTTTTLRFRVTRPYAPFAADASKLNASSQINFDAAKANWPYYTFSTKELAPRSLSDNPDKNALLDKINVTPNPYYGMCGYEVNRFDTKVKIINLPANVSVQIYALDGTLVRSLSKSDPETSYLDWDIRNAAGLPVASGLYLIHVKAEGIGEKVIKWFGALRPIDATSY